jgi:hypothetical protein
MLLDFPPRIEINDAWFNLMYFFWTNATYLPIFFFSLGGFMLISYSMYPHLFIFLITSIWFGVYCVEGSDFIALNVNLFTTDLTQTEVNLLLTNSLNKYHPGLFFISVIWLFVLGSLQLGNLMPRPRFSRNVALAVAPVYWFWLGCVNVIALFLGSWWAFQEGTWGGWWNWDASEVLGLIIGVFGFYSFHRRYSLLTWQAEILQINFSISVFLFSYFFTQLNFELISHNFAPVFLLFFTKNTFFVEMEGVILVTLWAQFYQSYRMETLLLTLVTTTLTPRSQVNERWLQVLGLWGVISGALLISFGPLMNHFAWTYFNLNSLGFFFQVTSYLYVFLIVLVLSFFNLGGGYWVSLLLLSCWSWEGILLFLPLCLRPPRRWATAVHIALTLFITLNLLVAALPFVEWFPWLRVGEIIYNQRLIFLYQSTYTCQSAIIEAVDVYSWHYTTTHTMWNAWYHSNSFSLHAFSLLLCPSGSSNFYNVSWGWWSLFLLIETVGVNTLVDIFLGGLIGTWCLWSQRQRVLYIF